MLGRQQIAALIPHQGAMCLLDAVVEWDAARVACRAHSHLDPANPLRRAGRLGVLAGIEYGLQAAALHGALRAGAGPAAPGYLAALPRVEAAVPYLDETAFGALAIEATVELSQPGGQIYAFRVAAEATGQTLLSGRATIVLPPAAAPPAAAQPDGPP